MRSDSNLDNKGTQGFLFSLDYTFNESLHYDERELTPT